jgi:hypothetical protein
MNETGGDTPPSCRERRFFSIIVPPVVPPSSIPSHPLSTGARMLLWGSAGCWLVHRPVPEQSRARPEHVGAHVSDHIPSWHVKMRITDAAASACQLSVRGVYEK